jgi:tetratricopeptide (TPR) repeat protein
MNIKTALATLLVALTLTTPLQASRMETLEAEAREVSGRKDKESEVYQRGISEIDSEDWNAAVKSFSKVIEMKGSRTDGALYWTAYALNRLGRKTEAKKSIDALGKAYPDSRWNDDAEALDLEMRQASGETVRPDALRDDELKMIAINSLMNTDPEKAYPMLEKIVRSKTATSKMKEQALFVLTQSSSPRAQALIGDLARGNDGTSLQKKAIKYLGINSNEKNRAVLSEIYASPSSSAALKRDILQSFMIAGDKSRVLAAAKGEKDAETRMAAIQLLGVMGARAELSSMYSSETSKAAREKILQALFIAGDSERLGQLARSEQDRELRMLAIRNLGLTGGKSTPALLALYGSESDREIKEAVIDGLFVQGNARTLIDLSKKEADKQLKKRIIQKLSVMGSDEAVEYMLQILEED